MKLIIAEKPSVAKSIASTLGAMAGAVSEKIAAQAVQETCTAGLPDFTEEQTFDGVEASVTEHFTTPRSPTRRIPFFLL